MNPKQKTNWAYRCVNLALWAGVVSVILALCFQREAYAQDYMVVVHAASKHGTTHDQYKFNESNPGVGIRYALNTDVSVQAGTYKNSYYKQTTYGVAQYTPVHLSEIDIGAFAGLATGYKHLFVAGLMAVVNMGNAAVTLRAVPKGNDKTVNMLAIEFGYKF